MRSIELAVGDPARSRAGSAITASLGIVAVFAAVTAISKETPALDLRRPWQDDPYDVAVSLDFVILPLLVGIGVLRVQLCRRNEPLPARRLLDLLRVASAALAVSMVTELAEWIAVFRGQNWAGWTAATTWQVAGVALLTAATIRAWIRVRSATRTVTYATTAGPQPDWLADAVALGHRAVRMGGHRTEWAHGIVDWTDTKLITRVRAHPIAAAGLLAVLLGSPIITAKIVLEGYRAPLVLLSFVFVTASLFAFVVAVGTYLRVVAPRNAKTPPWVSTLLAACIAGATAFALHDTLLAQQTVPGLSALFFGAAFAAGAASAVAQTLWRHFANPRRQ